jgi:hypothetical protein
MADFVSFFVKGEERWKKRRSCCFACGSNSRKNSTKRILPNLPRSLSPSSNEIGNTFFNSVESSVRTKLAERRIYVVKSPEARQSSHIQTVSCDNDTPYEAAGWGNELGGLLSYSTLKINNSKEKSHIQLQRQNSEHITTTGRISLDEKCKLKNSNHRIQKKK